MTKLRIKSFYFFLFSFYLLLFSCKQEPDIQFKHFPGKWHYNTNTRMVLKNLHNHHIDAIRFYIDTIIRGGAKVNDTLILPALQDIPLGKHTFIIRFYSKNNLVKEIKRDFTLYAQYPPVKLSYTLIKTYPHDIHAFTQGLEFKNDTLYESTGLNGQSSVRMVDYKTGKILKRYDFPPAYFGEGLTVWGDSLLVLTWQNGKGFVFDRHSLEQKGEFPYEKSKEGWGLTHNEKYIFKSDGTNKLWILDPQTLKEKDFIPVYAYAHPIKNLNELEYVNGKIFTNVWQKNALAVIDVATGQVVAVLDLSDLLDKVQKHPRLDVLNGIAYQPSTGHFFVTGKNWDKLFEIDIHWPEKKKKEKMNDNF